MLNKQQPPNSSKLTAHSCCQHAASPGLKQLLLLLAPQAT
jgi:hypothetical protein